MTQHSAVLLKLSALSDEQIGAIIPVFVNQAIAGLEKKADPNAVTLTVKDRIYSAEFIARFTPAIDALFTEEELLFLISFYQSEITRRFYKNSAAIYTPLYTALREVIQEILTSYPEIEKTPSNDCVVSLTNENYAHEVTASAIPVILDGYANWCAPCKALEPILSELSVELAGKVKFGKLNVDKEQELAKQLEIQAMPTILFIKNGTILERHIGLLDKAGFQAKLKKHFSIALENGGVPR